MGEKMLQTHAWCTHEYPLPTDCCPFRVSGVDKLRTKIDGVTQWLCRCCGHGHRVREERKGQGRRQEPVL